MVEELDVRVQVLVEVAAGPQRPGQRTDGVDREPQAEDDERPEGLETSRSSDPRRRASGFPVRATIDVRRRLACRTVRWLGEALRQADRASTAAETRRAPLVVFLVAVGVWWLQARAAARGWAGLRNVPRRLRRALPVGPDRPRLRARPHAGRAARRRRAARSAGRCAGRAGCVAPVRGVDHGVVPRRAHVRRTSGVARRSSFSSSIRATGSCSTRSPRTRSSPSRSQAGRSSSSGSFLRRPCRVRAGWRGGGAARPRPSGNQALLVLGLIPLVLGLRWRARVASVGACLAAATCLVGAWTVHNGVRFGDYTVARGGNSRLPFERAFLIERIVRPENGPASRRLAEAVESELLPEEPYRSYGSAGRLLLRSEPADEGRSRSARNPARRLEER